MSKRKIQTPKTLERIRELDAQIERLLAEARQGPCENCGRPTKILCDRCRAARAKEVRGDQ